MMPGMTQGDKTVQVAVLNLADVHVKLRRNQELAHAVEVDAMLDMKAEKGGKPVLYVWEDDQGEMSVPQQYQVCQLRVTAGEHPDVIVEGNEQGDLETETGEDTGCVGGSLRDSESSGYTNSSTSESKSCAGEDMLPEHLRAMYDNAKRRLSTEQAEKLCTILVMFADVFAKMILISASSQLLYIELGLVNPFLSRRDSEGLHLVLNRRSERLWIRC